MPPVARSASLSPRIVAAAVALPFRCSSIVSARVQSAKSFACRAFISSISSMLRSPGACRAATALIILEIGSSTLARWWAVTPTDHFSASVTFFQSASLSFSSVASASRDFASNCRASSSVFVPMVASYGGASLPRSP